MNVELYNTIIFTVEDKGFRCLVNCGKKRFSDLLDEYHSVEMNEESLFRPKRFQLYCKDKGYEMIYEG